MDNTSENTPLPLFDEERDREATRELIKRMLEEERVCVK